MFGIVVRMNEIVQHTRVIRMIGVNSFKKLRSLPLLLKSLGAFRDRTEDRQSIEQGGFVIRILGVDRRHRVAVIPVTDRFGSCTGVLIESGHCYEIMFLEGGSLLR
jgi:hypothetical protein